MAEEKIVFRCKHKDCRYRSNHFLYACDYSNFHEHTRVYGLPRDKWDPQYCDKYEPGKRVRKQIAYKKPPSFNHEEAMALYKSGLNDAEISRKMGCSLYRVQNWRITNKLKSNTKNGKRCSIDSSTAQALYHKGWSDVAIARELGCSSDTIRRWRLAHGLKAHKHTVPCSIDWVRGRALYDEGKTDTEISALLHCRADSVRKWRRREGLPPHAGNTRRTRVGERGQAEIKALYDRGLLDTEIAVAMGIATDTVYKYRYRMGLASNSSDGRRCVELIVDKPVRDGISYDNPSGQWWIFHNGKIVATAANELEAAKIYEGRK